MSDTGRLLADTTRQIIAQSPDEVTLFSGFVESGLHLALLPEKLGGGDCTLPDVAQIAECWGAHAAPLPIVEMLVSPWLGAQLGENVAGYNFTTVNWSPAAGYFPGEHESTAISIGEAPDFPGCTSIISGIALSKDEISIFIHPADKAHRFHNLAGQPWLRLQQGDGKAGAGEISVREGEFLALAGSALTMSVMVGAMDRIVALLVEYANTRVQFGRPIGKFQAVQHMIADCAAELAVTRAALDSVLRTAGTQHESLLNLLSAKAQAGRAATHVAAAAHQTFGAIGFTEEHELHHYTKLLWMLRDEWGRQSDCEQAVGVIALKAGRNGIWPAIVETGQFE
jgi:acyl-CoA dehydrogenase